MGREKGELYINILSDIPMELDPGGGGEGQGILNRFSLSTGIFF
jgi:hypothetical protein